MALDTSDSVRCIVSNELGDGLNPSRLGIYLKITLSESGKEILVK